MSTLKRTFKMAIGAASLMLVAGSAFAVDDIGTIGVRVGETISTWTTVVFLLSAMIGLAFCVGGTINLKKFSDNPQQNSWTKGAIQFLAGCLCFFLAYSTGVMQKTIFGNEDKDASQDYEFKRDIDYNPK